MLIACAYSSVILRALLFLLSSALSQLLQQIPHLSLSCFEACVRNNALFSCISFSYYVMVSILRVVLVCM